MCIYTHTQDFPDIPFPTPPGVQLKTHLSDQLQASKIFKLTRSARSLINPHK